MEDKLSLEELKEYGKVIINYDYYYDKDGVVDHTNEHREKTDIKLKVRDDWYKRFESKELARYCLQKVLRDKDEYAEDDEEYLMGILDDDDIYDLEATILAILAYHNDNVALIIN